MNGSRLSLHWTSFVSFPEISIISSKGAPKLTNMTRKKSEKTVFMFHWDIVLRQNCSEWNVSKEIYGTLLTIRLQNRSCSGGTVVPSWASLFSHCFFFEESVFQLFSSELRLLDGKSLGKVAESFSVEEFAVAKCIFTEIKCFIDVIIPMQCFEGK